MGAFELLKKYFEYDFVRNATIAGLLISLCAGLLGVMLVLKRYSMIGDGLSHVAFGAMAVAAVAGLAPMTVALPVTVLAAVVLLWANEKGIIKGDAAIAILSAGAMAIGYLLLNIFPSSDTGSISGDVCSSLFGSTSMMTLTGADVWLCVGLSVAVIAFFILCYHRIFAITFDSSFATSAGIRTSAYNLIISVVSGVVIVLAMKLVGALLISALIIFPSLSSMRVFGNFKAVVLSSATVAVVGSGIGLLLSLLYSIPTGATVVAVHLVIFLGFSAVGAIVHRK
jgi:zinc transport system permease protein